MKEHKSKFSGSGVAMVTPFLPDGEVDFKSLGRHTDVLIEQGINYLVVLGTTAETPTMDASEKADVIRCVVDACGGRVPVMVGAGINNTQAVVDCINGLDKNGVDGLLSVVPYYNKPSQEGIYQHYSTIAAISELPILLYNVPGRTGCNMSAETVLRLANDYPDTLIGVKEASGDFEQISSILRERPENFLVLSGDDVLSLPMISMGGDGVISVIGNAYPSQLSALIRAAMKEDLDTARELHLKMFPMMQAIFKEGNPAGIKAAMEIRGWLHNVLRLPLVPASAALQEEIRSLHNQLIP